MSSVGQYPALLRITASRLCESPLSMGFTGKNTGGDLPDPGIESRILDYSQILY